MAALTGSKTLQNGWKQIFLAPILTCSKWQHPRWGWRSPWRGSAGAGWRTPGCGCQCAGSRIRSIRQESLLNNLSKNLLQEWQNKDKTWTTSRSLDINIILGIFEMLTVWPCPRLSPAPLLSHTQECGEEQRVRRGGWWTPPGRRRGCGGEGWPTISGGSQRTTAIFTIVNWPIL